MTIGEVAGRAGVSSSAIRFYERSGLLPPARRASGQRRYDPAVLKQLAVVTLAREAGFTIREIRALFRDFTPDTTASTRWRSIADAKLQELDDVLRRTKLMRSVVTSMMECRCKTLEDCGEVIMRRTECVPRAPMRVGGCTSPSVPASKGQLRRSLRMDRRKSPIGGNGP